MEAITMSQALQLHPQTGPSSQNLNPHASNTTIRSLANGDDPEKALLFYIALQRQNQPLKPNNFTYPPLLKSCSRLRAASEGKQLHCLIHKSGLHKDMFTQNSLIHMYSSFQESEPAVAVFERITQKDVVSWTSIICGRVDNGHPIEALRLFDRMRGDNVAPNEATIVSVLRACADVGALSFGQKVHKCVIRDGIACRVNVISALIDMYAKCGCIESAKRVFENRGGIKGDVFVWTAMVHGLASNERCGEALDVFNRMRDLGVRPNARTATAVLCACRNAGWVDVGYQFFKRLPDYGIQPEIQHYGCVVDLLARAGYLEEAEELAKMIPDEPDEITWRTLIWACKAHGDIDRAERLVDEWLLRMDENDGSNYVLLGNVYAKAGKWEEKARLRESMVQKSIRKEPGFSRIELGGRIHEFVAGDSDHPQAKRIYERWNQIMKMMIEEGYKPKLSEVLLNVDDETKASQLHHHSEKLAVAFGLISTRPGTKILVVKNLRSCEDCHASMKLVSKITRREIVIRDRIRFHHFSNGACSCGDYW
ncbi:Pentatricopeptide repeat-containing protein [Acorus gramineus]|uniref:Pentatricopeptide repeat-containing protein n=1 Tax=Acorus gramineus TaxID=55184 RepID=A0AAV9AUV2_ACOGR|nr:Pentatricopeptide repeat-containing protein [Acorus gramineus]